MKLLQAAILGAVIITGAYYLMPLIPTSMTLHHQQIEPRHDRFRYERAFDRCMKIDPNAYGCHQHAKEMSRL